MSPERIILVLLVALGGGSGLVIAYAWYRLGDMQRSRRALRHGRWAAFLERAGSKSWQ